MADAKQWRQVALDQSGLITRAQLARAGVDRWAIAHRIQSERWQALSPTVIGTTTGALTREQLCWLGVLHAGPGASVGGLTAAEAVGLKNWHRERMTILVPYANDVPRPVEGLAFTRTRRDLDALRHPGAAPARCRLEPAILLFAAADRSARTAQGVLAAAVQQRLTTPEILLSWLERLKPLRKAPILRQALHDMAGGAHSLAEIDVKRLCKAQRLRQPDRQVKRRDADGKVRFTDCEWRLSDGSVLVLEIDGGFHMEVDHWEDDLARQRMLTRPARTVVRCTAREVREEGDRLARDLRALGVPAA